MKIKINVTNDKFPPKGGLGCSSSLVGEDLERTNTLIKETGFKLYRENPECENPMILETEDEEIIPNKMGSLIHIYLDEMGKRLNQEMDYYFVQGFTQDLIVLDHLFWNYSPLIHGMHDRDIQQQVIKAWKTFRGNLDDNQENILDEATDSWDSITGKDFYIDNLFEDVWQFIDEILEHYIPYGNITSEEEEKILGGITYE